MTKRKNGNGKSMRVIDYDQWVCDFRQYFFCKVDDKGDLVQVGPRMSFRELDSFVHANGRYFMASVEAHKRFEELGLGEKFTGMPYLSFIPN